MKPCLFLLMTAIIIVVLVSGCTRNGEQPLPGSPLGPGDYDFSIQHDGLTRKYGVHAPDSYDKNTPTPVIINFHGGGGNAESARDFTSMNQKSDEEGFMVVYPNGVGPTISGKLFGSWNAGACCPPNSTEDDVGFVNKLIDQLAGNFNVDESRIYATGLSNGALMTYRLACELSDRIAAFAPVAAVANLDKIPSCEPKRKVPIIHFHGTGDNCALYEGGTCGGCFDKILGREPTNHFACEPVEDYFATWREINNISDDFEITYSNGDARCVTYGEEGSEMTLCTIEGAGHVWPGGPDEIDTYPVCIRDPNSVLCKNTLKIIGNNTKDISANDLMWEFFEKHSI